MTLTDFIEDFFECSLDHELHLAIRDGSIPVDETFDIAYWAWRHHGAAWRDHASLDACAGAAPLNDSVPARPDVHGHLRPFVLGQAEFEGVDFGRPALNDLCGSDDTIFKAVDRLKQQLLYCHSVALENPMGDWITLSIFAMQTGTDSLWGMRRSDNLAQWLAFLVNIRPLTDADIVTWVETESAQRILGFPTDLLEQAEEIVARSPEIGACLPEADRGQLVKSVARTIDDVRSMHRHVGGLGGRVDYLLSHPLHDGVFALSRSSATQRARKHEQGYLRSIMDARIPALEQLDLADLVAIRQGEDAFDRWRHSVEERLRDVSKLLDSQDEDDRGEAQRRFDAGMREAERRLLSDLDESTLAQRLSRKVWTFGLSAPASWPAVLSFLAGTADGEARRNAQAQLKATKRLFVTLREAELAPKAEP